MLGKSHIKWRLCPDMTIAVDWDAKSQLKQTPVCQNSALLVLGSPVMPVICPHLSRISRYMYFQKIICHFFTR